MLKHELAKLETIRVIARFKKPKLGSPFLSVLSFWQMNANALN